MSEYPWNEKNNTSGSAHFTIPLTAFIFNQK